MSASRVIPEWQTLLCNNAGVNPEEYKVYEVEANWKLDFNRDRTGQEIPGTVVIMTETRIPVKIFKNKLMNSAGIFSVLDELGALLPVHEVLITCEKRLWRDSHLLTSDPLEVKEGRVGLTWALLQGPDGNVIPGMMAAIGVFPVELERLRHRTLAPDGFPAGLRNGIRGIKGRLFIHESVLVGAGKSEGTGPSVRGADQAETDPDVVAGELSKIAGEPWQWDPDKYLGTIAGENATVERVKGGEPFYSCLVDQDGRKFLGFGRTPQLALQARLECNENTHYVTKE